MNDDPRQLIESFACPSRCVHDAERVVVFRLTEVIKEVLLRKYKDHVYARRHDPLLIVYGSDCTPVMNRERYRQHFRNLDVVRKPKQGNEWLIQRLFVKDLLGRTSVLFTEPLRMIRKTAWAHLEAARQLAPLPRELGHEGPLVFHLCFDRAVQGAASRHFEELCASLHQQMSSSTTAGRARLMDLLTWNTTSGCALHDTHGGFRRSMLDYVDDAELMKNAWVCVQAIRQSMNVLARGIFEWLPGVLDFVDWDLPDDEQRILWEVLGLDEPLIDAQMALKIRWDEGSLKVNPAAQADPEAPQAIATTLLAMWRIQEWTDSRWGTMGSSSRSVALARLTGLQALLSDLRRKPYVSEFYTSGIDRLSDEVAHMFVVGAIGSWLTDSILQILFDDDRLPLVIASIDEEVSVVYDWLGHLPDGVWRVLAGIASAPPQCIRSEALSIVLASASYAMWRFLDVREAPFTLMGENKEQKLAEFLASPMPERGVPKKIWELDHIGYARESVIGILEVAEQASWSFMVGEQGHATCTRVMKHHPDYGQNMMACRSTIMQAAPLVSDTPEEKRYKAAVLRCARLGHKRPQNISGRHMFCKELIKQAQASKGKGGMYDDPEIGKKVFRFHAKPWSEADAGKRQLFEDEALQERARKRQRLEDDRTIARASLQIERGRLRESLQRGGPHRMSSCKFTDVELSAFADLLKGGAMSDTQIAERRARAQLGVDEPPKKFQHALSSFAPASAVKAAPLLPWVRSVCQHRSCFKQALFRLKTADSEEIFRFAWAMQNPLVLGLVCCDPAPLLARALQPSEIMGRADVWDMEYQLLPTRLKFSDRVGDLCPEASVEVKQVSTIMSGFIIGTDCEWQSFDKALATMGIQGIPATSARAPPQKKQSPDPALVTQNPWLLDLLGGLGSSVSSAPRAVRSPAPVAENDLGDEPLPQDAVEAAFDALHQRRAEVAGADAAVAQGFAWTVLGGKWTLQHRGVAFDSYRGQASSKAAKEWAASHHLQASSTFSLAKYGPEICGVLVQCWTDKMNHFYEVSGRRPAPAFSFSEQHAASFGEKEEFSSLFGSAPHAVVQRAQALRELRPRSS